MPDVNADISLVGLQPFIGLCNLHLTTNYVILISKITDGKRLVIAEMMLTLLFFTLNTCTVEPAMSSHLCNTGKVSF